MQLKQNYEKLLELYGPQGWWPLLEVQGTNPTKTGSIKGYHPGDYSYPKTDRQRFEICIGALLTQNTAWSNVEKALLNLEKLNAINPKKILEMHDEKLREAIRPAGYFNQKAKKLKIFAAFYLSAKKMPTREELLALWGIGPETADSMLLYAFKVPTFVVDAYTRRVFNFPTDMPYDEIKRRFESAIAPDAQMYQEYHALIVEHAKNMLPLQS